MPIWLLFLTEHKVVCCLVAGQLYLSCGFFSSRLSMLPGFQQSLVASSGNSLNSFVHKTTLTDRDFSLNKNRIILWNFHGFVYFLSRVNTLTRDIDIAFCPSVVRNAPVSDENGLTYYHNFLPYGSPIILVLPASNIFTKFRRGHPLQGH